MPSPKAKACQASFSRKRFQGAGFIAHIVDPCFSGSLKQIGEVVSPNVNAVEQLLLLLLWLLSLSL